MSDIKPLEFEPFQPFEPMQPLQNGGSPFAGYDFDPKFYDEMFAADEQPRPSYAPLQKRLLDIQAGELEEYQKTADLSFSIRASPSRFTATTRHRAYFPLRFAAAHYHVGRMGRNRERFGATINSVEFVFGRHLRRRQSVSRRHHSARTDLRLQALSPRTARRAPAQRYLGFDLRLGHYPRRARHLHRVGR